MKTLYKVLTVLCLIYLFSMYLLGKNTKEKVLGTVSEVKPSPTPVSTINLTQTSEPTDIPTPTNTLTPKPVPTSTPTITSSPTPKPTPTPVGASSSEINSFIERFASQYGVDPNVLRYIAICESGFRSNAENAGYVGLYQFGPITWKNIRQEFGEDIDPNLRYSAEESVQTASYALSKGKNGIWPNCQP